jgi:hypothetical protein
LSVGTVHATIGGKNVILIHGFLPSQIISPPDDNGEADAKDYWNEVNTAFHRQDGGTSNIIYWPSTKRLTGSDGIISVVVPQISTLLAEGYCDDQCVILTHSSGDLIARFLLKNKASIFGDLADRLKVAAVFDLAGAGGGTELANYAVGIAEGVNYTADVVAALLEYIGVSVKFGLNVGVINDLQPAVARSLATNGFPSVPHLRVAGSGTAIYGVLTHALLLGKDDSVVPLHSACGAASALSYESCSPDIRIDGRVTSVSAAPSLSELYDFHYPLIMGKSIAHSDMEDDVTGNAMTSVRLYETAYADVAGSLPIDIDDYEKREWWSLWRTYRWIRDADNKSVTTVLADSVVQ